MSQAAIRTAIYNVVNGVANVGLVYDYERHSNDWVEFLDRFKATTGGLDHIRGWMVGYRGITEAQGNRFKPAAKRVSRTHRFQILGVMGIDDSEESEKTFAELAEDVCDALDSDTTIHGYMGSSPATLGFDPRPFAGILVHAAAIVIDVTEAI